MDAAPTGGLEYRPLHPVISWGFGGSLVTAFPGGSSDHDTVDDPNGMPSTVSHAVRVYDLGAVFRDFVDDDLAAVVGAVPPPNFPAIPPDLLPLADMYERLANKYVGLKTEKADNRSALWILLALMCKSCTADWRSQASSAVPGPTPVPTCGRSNSSFFLSDQASRESSLKHFSSVSRRKELEQMEAAAEVERLISQGVGAEAIRVAQGAWLWLPALVLA